MNYTDRPSNEVTTGVVAKQFKNEEGLKDFRIGRRGSYGISKSVVLCTGEIDGKVVYYDEDPRDDPDAALRLQHWVVNKFALCVFKHPEGWNIISMEPELVSEFLIPISGEGFRNAVVNLTAQVTGVV